MAGKKNTAELESTENGQVRPLCEWWNEKGKIGFRLGDETYEDLKISLYEVHLAEAYHDLNTYQILDGAMNEKASAAVNLVFISTLASDPQRNHREFIEQVPFGNVSPFLAAATELIDRDGAGFAELSKEAEAVQPKKKGGSKKKAKAG